MTDCLAISRRSFLYLFLKVAATDIRYFGKNDFPKILIHKEKFWFDIANSFEVKIHILSKEVGYPLLV